MTAALDTFLFQSPIVTIGQFRCPISHPSFRNTGPISSHLIVFPRTAVTIQHVGQRPLLADPNVAMLYNRNQEYYRFPVSKSGDRCEWFAFSQDAIADAIRTVDPGVEDRPARPFRLAQAFCPDAIYRFQRQIVRFVARQDVADPMAVEEAAMEVLRRLASTMPHRGKARSDKTRDAHAELVEHVRLLLAQRFTEKWTLSSIAEATDCSPFHLARVFREQTSLTIHQYQTQLRLRAAIERLEDESRNLTMVALELGFHSHSHFTNVFRCSFGCSPSKMRELMRSGRLR